MPEFLLANPWGLLALAALPAIVVLHLWRRRQKKVRVSGLFLYPAISIRSLGGRTRQPLKRDPVFFCELLAALFAALALAGPVFDQHVEGRSVSIVLDGRWWMQAQVQNSIALERGQRAAKDWIQSLEDGDRLTLIESGEPPRILAGPKATRKQALEALNQWKANAPWHSTQAAWTLASELAGANAARLWIGDRPDPQAPAGSGFLSVGLSAQTSGFVDARCSYSGSQAYVDLRLRSVGGAAQRVLRLESAGPVERIACDLPAETPKLLRLPLPEKPSGQECLRLSLEGPDPLSIDDVLSVPYPAQSLSIALPLASGQTSTATRRTLALISGAHLVETGPCDLAIGRTEIPARLSVVLAAGTGPAAMGPFLARRGHPALEGTDTRGLVWSASATSVVAGEVLMSAGHNILMSTQTEGRNEVWFLHTQAELGNLLRHPFWPALLANAAEYARSLRQIPPTHLYLPGAFVRLPLETGIWEAQLEDPQGLRQTLGADREGRIQIHLPRPGQWKLHTGSRHFPLTVPPIDERLMDLSGAETLSRPPQLPPRRPTENARRELALPLICLAILCLLASWFFLARQQEKRT